jgi:MFS family permease
MVRAFPRVTDRRVHRLAVTLLWYAFLDDLVLLYPVYPLLFSDTGLSVWQISSLFVIWSVTGLVLEVPSGALADAVSRRLLLWTGPLLGAAGFGLWVVAPSYWVFAAGFVLWGAKGAAVSGALEALVFDELTGLGAGERYARLMGRARAAGAVAVLLATAAAAPLLAVGGYRLLGAASVLAGLLGAAVAARFPDHRPPGRLAVAASRSGYLAALGDGLAEVRRDRSVRGAVLLVPAVAVIWVCLEEYVPLLVRDTGIGARAVPLWLVLIWVGVTVGGLAAPAAERTTARDLGSVLAVAAVLLAAGAGLGGPVGSGGPVGIGLIAVAFGGFQWATVVSDARLQRRITGPARATVTSFGAVATEVATLGMYGAYPAVAVLGGHAAAFVAFAVPYLAVAAWLVGGGLPPLPVEADHGPLNGAEPVVRGALLVELDGLALDDLRLLDGVPAAAPHRPGQPIGVEADPHGEVAGPAQDAAAQLRGRCRPVPERRVVAQQRCVPHGQRPVEQDVDGEQVVAHRVHGLADRATLDHLDHQVVGVRAVRQGGQPVDP